MLINTNSSYSVIIGLRSKYRLQLLRTHAQSTHTSAAKQPIEKEWDNDNGVGRRGGDIKKTHKKICAWTPHKHCYACGIYLSRTLTDVKRWRALKFVYSHASGVAASPSVHFDTSVLILQNKKVFPITKFVTSWTLIPSNLGSTVTKSTHHASHTKIFLLLNNTGS